MQKGLIVNILKHENRSFDGDGQFSSKTDCAILLPNADFPNIPEIFESNELFYHYDNKEKKYPPVVIVKRKLFGTEQDYLTAYPVINGKVETERCFGGTYIVTSDSRFPAKYPVPLHDRPIDYNNDL